MLTEFQDVFAINEKDEGKTSILTHKINTRDAQPIRYHPKRLPLAKRDEIEEIIEDMSKQGVIEPSNSSWTSRVVLVRKKDGSTRFCVDFRQLNAVNKRDSYPLPRIDDTLDTLSGPRWFSTLDSRLEKWLLASRKWSLVIAGRQLFRLERLQEYDYDIEHRAGKIHQNADALSRRPCSANYSKCSKLDDRFCHVRRTTVVNDYWQP